MHRSLFSIFLLLPLLCSAAKEKVLPERQDSKTNDYLTTAFELFTKLSEGSKKGGAAIAAKVVSDNIDRREEFFQAAYATLDRSPFSGVLPRCLCKVASCALAPCYSMCTRREAVNSDIFDCSSCIGDCIPMFMRCIASMDKVKFIFLALFALLQPAASIANIRSLLEEMRTKEASIIADSIDVLQEDYDYSEDVIKKAFERCREESGVSLVPCFIDSLHVQKLLHDHKYHLCAFYYVLSVAADCAADCFDHYNVNCLTCVGKPMPSFINCLKKGPHQYSSYNNECESSNDE